MTNRYKMWLEVKELERQAKARRYELEAQIAEDLRYDGSTGKSEVFDVGDMTVKFVGRTNWKVDHDYLMEIATENMIPMEELQEFFRFKTELEVTNWKKSQSNLKPILEPALIKKVARSSLKIEPKE